MLYTLIEHTLSTSDSVRYIRTLLGYNKARVLALNKSYWAAINKIFIYARPSVNKMAWVFFFHLSFRPVRLQYSFPSLWNMEETIEELPNFSIGIDLLGPYPTSNKNKAEKKLANCTFRKFVGGRAAANFGRKTFTGNKKGDQLVICKI